MFLYFPVEVRFRASSGSRVLSIHGKKYPIVKFFGNWVGDRGFARINAKWRSKTERRWGLPDRVLNTRRPRGRRAGERGWSGDGHVFFVTPDPGNRRCSETLYYHRRGTHGRDEFPVLCERRHRTVRRDRAVFDDRAFFSLSILSLHGPDVAGPSPNGPRATFEPVAETGERKSLAFAAFTHTRSSLPFSVSTAT